MPRQDRNRVEPDGSSEGGDKDDAHPKVQSRNDEAKSVSPILHRFEGQDEVLISRSGQRVILRATPAFLDLAGVAADFSCPPEPAGVEPGLTPGATLGVFLPDGMVTDGRAPH